MSTFLSISTLVLGACVMLLLFVQNQRMKVELLGLREKTKVLTRQRDAADRELTKPSAMHLYYRTKVDELYQKLWDTNKALEIVLEQDLKNNLAPEHVEAEITGHTVKHLITHPVTKPEPQARHIRLVESNNS